MPSNSELHLMTQLLNLPGFKVKDYRIIEGIGIILSLENTKKKVICPHCTLTTELLHQNNFQTRRDFSFGQRFVDLKIPREWRCLSCQNKFTEELDFVRKRRIDTQRFVEKIIEEVLNSDLKNVPKRNELSEQEIETMLKDLGRELVAAKPINLKRLGIDEIAVVKGPKNSYVVLVDLDKRKIVGLVEKRREKEVTESIEAWGEEILAEIKEVSIDLWKP